MAFVTYILVAGLVMGTQNRYGQEIISQFQYQLTVKQPGVISVMKTVTSISSDSPQNSLASQQVQH